MAAGQPSKWAASVAIPMLPQCVEKLAGRVDGKSSFLEVLVLRADGQVQRQRQGYHRPVVRIALTDALRRLLTGVARSASSARSGSIFALTARPGKCSATSSATVTGLKQRGPWSDSNTRCARPPMRAERTTLASGMTAAGRDRVSARLYEAALRRRWRTWRKS